METSNPRRYRSGLSELITALARARTAAEVADAVWTYRGEACGAAAVGIVVADPDTRPLPGTGPGGAVPLALDPLLLAEFAYAPAPLFFGSAAALLDRYPVLGTVGTTPPGAACAVLPLTGPDTGTGALVVVWDRPRRFSAGDRGLLVALSGLCSAELARTRPLDRERDAVDRMRRRLRPGWLPFIAGAELAVRHQPTDRTDLDVGFYDVFDAGDGAWRLVAGNVRGPGVDAAVLAGVARQAFRTDVQGGPAAALGRLDRLIRDFGDPAGPVSAVCVDLSRRGRGFTLTAARAGHPAPLVLRATGAVVTVDVPGGALGSGPEREPAELGLELRPGDAVLLSAGGTSGGGLVGDPRFAAVLAGCAGWSADVLLEHVGLALTEHGGPPGYGTSFLALRVRGGRTRSAAGAWLPA